MRLNRTNINPPLRVLETRCRPTRERKKIEVLVRELGVWVNACAWRVCGVCVWRVCGWGGSEKKG